MDTTAVILGMHGVGAPGLLVGSSADLDKDVLCLVLGVGGTQSAHPSRALPGAGASPVATSA